MDQGTDLGRTGIGNGVDLDELGIVDGFGARGGEAGGEVDTPVGREPEEGLDGDDEGTPDKGPLLATEVLVVELRGQVVAEKDGPDKGKGPDVGVQVQRQRTEQLRVLDLRVGNGGRSVGHDGGALEGLSPRNEVM